MKTEKHGHYSGMAAADISHALSGSAIASLFQPSSRSWDEHFLAYRGAIDQVAILAYTDQQGRIIDANDHFCRISQYGRDELIGANHNIVNSGHHHPAFFRHMWRTISKGKIWRGEICNRGKNGDLYWVDTVIAPQLDADGEICGYVSVRLDITARKEAETQLWEENRRRRDMEALLDDIVDTVPNGIVAYDSGGHIIFFNKANRDIYGDVAPLVEIGRRREDVLAQSQLEPLLMEQDTSAFLNLSDSNKSIVHRLPGDRWIQVQNRKSSSGTLVSVQTDVTDLKRAERQIKFQAERDPLTGIYNRHALFARLSEYCQQLALPCTLALIDLDGFKAINDRMGHDAGDALLRQVAGHFQSALRHTDTVARLGGDEFAILLPGANSETDISLLMDKLMTALTTPVRFGQQTVIPSGSMGVAVYPRDGKSPEELMKSADLAMYQCKHNGRGSYAVYNMTMRRQRMRRASLTEKLRSALEKDEIRVVLQPQCDMSNGRHTGFEALVRWQVQRRWIPPQELISIAEEAGLVTQLSHRIMDKALAMMARLKAAGREPGVIAFNVVAAQLHMPDFACKLTDLLNKHGVSPREVEIEVTENVVLDRSAVTIAQALRKLHASGMSIALDDFGTGYASLKHLKRFPLNRLKIDRSFVSGIMKKKDDHIIVRTIISLAHSLGLQVVAEGIETTGQYQELSNLGCDIAQGYLISRPMNEDSLAAFLDGMGTMVGQPLPKTDDAPKIRS